MIDSLIKYFIFLGKIMNFSMLAFSYKKCFGASFKAPVKLNIF